MDFIDDKKKNGFQEKNINQMTLSHFQCFSLAHIKLHKSIQLLENLLGCTDEILSAYYPCYA